MIALSEFLVEAIGRRGCAAACVIASPGAEPESSWMPETKDEPAFLIYSITKTFIATIALQLVEEGRLRLDEKMAEWLADIDQSQEITLRQLLNHTAGIPDYGSLQHYHDAVRSSPSKAWSSEDFARQTYEKGLAFPPGEGWLYSNPGYMLLKKLLERASNTPFAELVAKRACKPVGLVRTSVVETIDDLGRLTPAPSTLLSADGSALDVRHHYDPGWVSHGVIASTASEVALFFDALLTGKLLSSAMLAEMKKLMPLPEHIANHLPYEAGYGLGLMGGTRRGIAHWGHGGGGPGYTAGVFHRSDIGRTACVLAAIEDGLDAQELAMDLLRV